MAYLLVVAGSLGSCTGDQKNDVKKTKQEKENRVTKKQQGSDPLTKKKEDKETESKSSFSILEQLHKDTILRRVRLPRYDEHFAPKSLLTAKTMEVIDGQTIEAKDVSMELYNPDGSIKARTKMRRAIYKEDDATLEASEAIWINGQSFEVSGSGLVYDTLNGRGFVLGPASTLFQIKRSGTTNGPKQEETN